MILAIKVLWRSRGKEYCGSITSTQINETEIYKVEINLEKELGSEE